LPEYIKRLSFNKCQELALTAKSESVETLYLDFTKNYFIFER